MWQIIKELRLHIILPVVVVMAAAVFFFRPGQQETVALSASKANCENGILTIQFEAIKDGENVWVYHIDDKRNGWNERSPNEGDIKGTSSVAAVTVDVTPGHTYGWWAHQRLKNKSFSKPTGGVVYCQLSSPANLSSSRDGSVRRFTWAPVPGAVRYAVRIDNTANGWNDEVMNEGDVSRNSLTETMIEIPYEEGKSYNWWVHAVDEKGIYSKPAGGEVRE